MIFVTVGTHQQPFVRLVEALTALASEELVVQHGPAPAPAGVAKAVPFLSFPEMLDYFERADAVITHAGVGSILLATNAGHVPIVVPRLKELGEHVDDHQVHLINELERDNRVKVVWDTSRLAEAIAGVPPRGEPLQRNPGPLQANVRAALLGQSIDPALAG